MKKLTLEERDMRYAAVRSEMKRMGLDAMLVICDAQIEKKGYLKYLTNYRNSLYNLVAIFPLEGEAKLLVPSEVQVFWASRLSWIDNVWYSREARRQCNCPHSYRRRNFRPGRGLHAWSLLLR